MQAFLLRQIIRQPPKPAKTDTNTSEKGSGFGGSQASTPPSAAAPADSGGKAKAAQSPTNPGSGFSSTSPKDGKDGLNGINGEKGADGAKGEKGAPNAPRENANDDKPANTNDKGQAFNNKK